MGVEYVCISETRVCLEPTVCATLGIKHVLMSFTHKIVMKNHLFKQLFN